MAAVQFNCPHCQGAYQVDETLGGMQVSCPHCQQVATLPESLAQSPSTTATSGVSQFNCPQCNGEFRVGSSMAGQQVACPHCSSVVTVSAGEATFQASSVPQKPVAPQPSPTPKPSAAPAATTDVSMYPPGFGPAGKIEPSVPKSPEPAPNADTPSPIPVTTAPTQTTTQPSPSASANLYPPGFGTPPTVDTPVPVDQPKSAPVVPTPTLPTPAPVVPAKPQAAGETAVPSSVTRPTPAPSSAPAEINSNVDELLPPGVASSALASESLPTELDGFLPSSLPVTSTADKAPEGMVVLPSEDGGYVTVRESTKTVEYHGEEVELHRLTPEEKQRKRFFKNLVMAFVGILFLSAVTIILVFLT